MKQALVVIANGTEEIEAVTVIDVLRRAAIQVTVASVESSALIQASRGVKIEADSALGECTDTEWDVIVLPGGMPGAEALGACQALISLLSKQLAAERWVGAICASAAVVLGRNALISSYRATCYPSFQSELASQVVSVDDGAVVIDRNLITSQGPATAMLFSLALVSALVGEQTAQNVAEAMLVSQECPPI